MAANMNPPNQFGSAKPVRTGEGITCAQCEALLPDWMDHATDGELTAKDRAAFELHIATCAECSQMLADAQRGAALLDMLKSPRPEPSDALLDRIIANTSGVMGRSKSRIPGMMTFPAIDGAAVEIHSVTPVFYPLSGHMPMAVPTAAGNVLPFRSRTPGRFNLKSITHTMMQPRLAMTAAMAFFSIALTLNLTGVHLNELSVGDLKPSNLRRTFYQADASVVRYYDNLRVVYELESRVQDLKRSNESDNSVSGSAATDSDSKTNLGTDSTKTKSKQDQPRKQSPKAGSGTSQRRFPMLQDFRLADFEKRGVRFDAVPAELFSSTGQFDNQKLRTSKGTTNKLKETIQEGVPA